MTSTRPPLDVEHRYVVAGSRGCYTVIDKQRNDRRVAGPYSWDTAVRACAAWNGEVRCVPVIDLHEGPVMP